MSFGKGLKEDFSQQFPMSKFRLFQTEFAHDIVKFDENGRQFSKWVENNEGKGGIVRYKQFLLFPQRFQKTCTADT